MPVVKKAAVRTAGALAHLEVEALLAFTLVPETALAAARALATLEVAADKVVVLLLTRAIALLLCLLVHGLLPLLLLQRLPLLLPCCCCLNRRFFNVSELARCPALTFATREITADADAARCLRLLR